MQSVFSKQPYKFLAAEFSPCQMQATYAYIATTLSLAGGNHVHQSSGIQPFLFAYPQI
jgi:hypothetical protein